MDEQEAIRQAQAHLQNAQELAQRPVGKEELLYMWDNQITALDNFLAETETLKDQGLNGWRGKLRDAKKKLTDAVVRFEAQQVGEDLGEDGDEPPEEEQVEMFVELATDMLALVREALDEPVTDVKDLVRWEEPLAVVNGYLADSEPYQEKSRELQKARSVVRVARRDLKNHIDEVFKRWRAHQDDDEGED